MTDPNVPDVPPAVPPVPPAAPPAPPYAPPPAAPYGSGPAKPSTVLSLLSLIAGILGVLLICCCGGWLPGIAAIVLGHLGKNKENAQGMALAGLIMGYAAVAFSLIFAVLVFFFPAVLASMFPWADFYSSYNFNY